MTATCLGSGFRAAFAQRRLIATVWIWNLLLAIVVAAGTSRWLGSAFDFSPEADRTLQRFQFGLFLELQQYDRFSPFTFLNGTVLGLILLSAVSNPLLSAGVLEVLVSRDDRPVLHRFFRGAGHFFGRFLRLLAISGAALMVLAIVITAIGSAISRGFGSAGWERVWLTAGLVRLVLLVAMAALVMAVLDVARARVIVAPTEIRGMVRAWTGAARSVFGHFGALSGIYVALGAVWLALAAIGLGIVSVTPATNWVGIWLLIGVQQIFMVARATLRIARAGATLEYVGLTTERAEPAATKSDSAYPADSAVSL